jgi:O-acetyl-ADP-ribose deacetylase (regulator of RNase III)
MKFVHRCKLKHLVFTLAEGDIFDAKVDAIVNSEQTDFILSGNPKSLSGQIRERYGDLVQCELNAETKGQVLDPGAVIHTTGGQDFKCIFHAGFHDPYDWPDRPGKANSVADCEGPEFRQTDYFAAIGSCITQILTMAMDKKLKSVAFPLIGCGIFGLDEKMLILQFIDIVEEFDRRLTGDEELQVWLVIHDPTQFKSVAGTFLDLLMQARGKMVSVQMERTGVSILDQFAKRISANTNEDWAKWRLCHYAEIAIEFMCYGISRAIHPPKTPERMFKENSAWTFGTFLKEAKKLAGSSEINSSTWGACFFRRILQEGTTSVCALDKIIEQRNNLAHGRQSLPLAEIKNLLNQGLELDAWKRIPETDLSTRPFQRIA